MKYDIPFRVTVTKPLDGVLMRVQYGRDGLLEPFRRSKAQLEFEFEIAVDLNNETPNFLGPFTHGPKDARFVYVNSGSQAGQTATMWNRRAKLSLMEIARHEIETVIRSKDVLIGTTIDGIGKDGGPVCASVKNFEWKVTKK